MASTLWRIRMLGGLALERVGQPPVTRFRSRKTAALLAYLALYPRQHTREALATLFWPDAPVEQAQQSLRSALASLRRQLEPPEVRPGTVLHADRLHAYLQRGTFATDAAEFAAAARRGDAAGARALYAGPLLPGIYEDWAVLESERFQDIFERLAGVTPDDGPLAAESAAPAEVPEPERVSVPVLLDRFFGRDEELSRLLALSTATGGLTTLIGPGGAGKTRLAVEAARRWPGTVWFVTLADCADPQEAPERVALALGVAGGQRPAAERVAERLRGAPGSLLVLDNLEQIAGVEVAAFLAAVRRAAPGSRLLATSRQRLVVPGEELFAVGALPVPAAPAWDAVTAAELGELARSPGVALFVDRAQSCRADFQITPRNAGAVASLVSLLDGVPLSLELAASWVGAFTPRQIGDRLAETFAWLESRQPSAHNAGRHRSLWAVASWSYGLLPEELRRLFRRLAIFPGGATLEAVREVVGAGAEEGLLRLLERSLVRSLADEEAGGSRFALPEALREFAAERCAAEEDYDALCARHAAYFRCWLTGTDRGQAAVAAELPNLLAASRYAGRAGDDGGQVAVARALWRCLYHSGLWEQGDRLLGEGMAAAERIGDERARADFHMAGAAFAFLRADYGAARRAKVDAAARYEAVGDRGRAAKARADAGAIALVEGDIETGIRLIEAEIDVLRVDPAMRVSCFETLQNLGIAYLRRAGAEDLVRAEELIREAVSRAETASPGSAAYCRMAWGDVALMQGRLADAEGLYAAAADGLRADRMEHRFVEALMRHSTCLLRQDRSGEAASGLREALSLAQRLGLREMLVVGIEATSDWLFRRGVAVREAARLWGAAEAARVALPLAPTPAHAEFMRRMGDQAARFPAPRRAGRKLPLEQAGATALELLHAGAAP